MGTVNAINERVDLTVRVFDQFYNFNEAVPSNEYDAVNSYFQSVMTDKSAARNFTTALFRISQNTGINVLTLLSQVQQSANDTIGLNLVMAYFLNGTRSPSTLLGVNSIATPNVFVARNIKA